MKFVLREETCWTALYAAERTRLMSALGHVTERGQIEAIAHVGATGVPGLQGGDCVDIALTMWPYPPAERAYEALHTLGYRASEEAAPVDEIRFLRRDGRVQLWVSRAGGATWHDHVVLRNYLQNEPSARQQYHALRRRAAPSDIAAAKQRLLPELLADAHAWWIERSDFEPVKAVGRVLANFEHPWFISSGWAIDLFLGRVTRYHHDVDVAVPRAAQLALQRHMAQRGWRWVTPLDGRLEPWPPRQFLELPRHQAHAHRTGEFIDFLLTDFRAGCWIYRRDPRIVRAATNASLTWRYGLRYLAPELVLLFKSKNTGNQARPQDQADFENAAPLLDAEPRAWLRRALTTVDPENPWLVQL